MPTESQNTVHGNAITSPGEKAVRQMAKDNVTSYLVAVNLLGECLTDA